MGTSNKSEIQQSLDLWGCSLRIYLDLDYNSNGAEGQNKILV